MTRATIVKRLNNSYNIPVAPFHKRNDIAALIAREQLKKFDVKMGLSTHKAPDNWREWTKAIFPGSFNSAFTEFHIDYWEWLWQAAENLKTKSYTRPYAMIWPRGFGKSINLAAAVVLLGCSGYAPYIRYISESRTQAEQHLRERVVQKINSSNMRDYYPSASEPKINQITGRTRQFNSTVYDFTAFMLEAGGLGDQGGRGGAAGDHRVFVNIFDDFDGEFDPPKTRRKKIQNITGKYLNAMEARGAINIFGQNLIYDKSIMSMIADGSGGFLNDVKVNGPIKAIDDMEYEYKFDTEKKKNWWFITGGTATWPSRWPLDVCEDHINLVGHAFFSEMQNEVDSRMGSVYSGSFSIDNIYPVYPDPRKDIHLMLDDGYTIDPRAIGFIQQDGVGGDIRVFDEVVNISTGEKPTLARDAVKSVFDKLETGWAISDEVAASIANEGRSEDLYRRERELHKKEVNVFEHHGMSDKIDERDGRWFITEWWHKAVYEYDIVIDDEDGIPALQTVLLPFKLPSTLVSKKGEHETPAAFDRAFNLQLFPVTSKIKAGIKKVRELLTKKNEDALRCILINIRCEMFIHEHRFAYKYDDEGNEIDKDNHFCDAFRYFIQRFGDVEPI